MSKTAEKHWTSKHIRDDDEGRPLPFIAYDEAGLQHGRYDSYDEARDALVLYSFLQLEGKVLLSKEDIAGLKAKAVEEFLSSGKIPEGVHLTALLNFLQRLRAL